MQTGVAQMLLGGLMSCGSLWKFYSVSSQWKMRESHQLRARMRQEVMGGVCVCWWGARGSRGFEHHTALQALGLWSWTESRASLPQLVGCSLVAQMVKNLPVMQEIRVWSLRRKWQPLQYSCLENPMERASWASPWVRRVGYDWTITGCGHGEGWGGVFSANYDVQGGEGHFQSKQYQLFCKRQLSQL